MSYLIAVDSGHGMETAGKRTPVFPDNWLTKKKGDIIHEKEFNKPAAEYLIQALERCGFKTINVSPGTVDVSLKERYTAANNAKADAFVSKHYNAFKGIWGIANGIETIVSQYANSKAAELAHYVQVELVKAHKRTDRGVKTDIKQSGINIAVLRNATMPAILTESGFMDNIEEAKTMIDPVFQKADAEATCRGICKYFGVTYLEEFNMPTKSITKRSSKEDIKWLQDRLNNALSDESNIPLKVDGIYGNKTRIAVLIYWEKLRWNKEGTGDGWRVGAKTINSLI
jgi:N-acetylmuramoyl-L-alanine amidase